MVPDTLEIKWIKSCPKRLPRSISQLFHAAVYSPPGNQHADQLVDHLQQTIDHITTANPDDGNVIAEDLNRLDFSQLTSGNLVQVVKKPTRHGCSVRHDPH